jgi:hypothetical protein
MDLPINATNYLASKRSVRKQYFVKVSKNFRPTERRWRRNDELSLLGNREMAFGFALFIVEPSTVAGVSCA